MSHDNRDLAYLAGIIGAAALFGIGALFLASATTKPPCNLERVAYAPSENLEPIDVALIGRARHSIDFVAYVLTSIPILEVLDVGSHFGVTMRFQENQ